MSETQHPCYYQECQKLFRSKYNLVRHINTKHLHIKNYVCSECSKAFGSRQNLESHQRTHASSTLTILDKIVSHNSVFRLSDHYREVFVVPMFEIPPLPLPSLPKIDEERQENQMNRKLPITLDLIKE